MTTTVILTNYGNDKILQAIAEETTITVSAITYGDGNGSEYVPSPTQTNLRHELGSINLLEKRFDSVEGFIYFSGVIEASSADFTIRELGLLDEESKLLAIATIPSTSKPSTSEGIEVSLPISIGFKTSIGSVLIVEHDASETASKQWTLDNFQLLSEKGQSNGYAPLNGDGVVPPENSLVKYDVIGNTTYDGDVAKTVILQNEIDIPMLPLSDIRNTRNDEKVSYWVGTREQYIAITTKDPDTIYNLSDSKEIYKGEDLIANVSNSRNIGEVIPSVLPLEDAGLHLLDGALISEGGAYDDFVDYIDNLYHEHLVLDGTTWSAAVQDSNLGDSNYWHAIAYGNNKFVALGSYGYTSTSDDGITWTTAASRSDLGNNHWQDLAYDGDKFVALGQTGYISTSVSGTSWTEATQIANLVYAESESDLYWMSITYDGTKFLALSIDGYVSTSVDGTSWTEATQIANLANTTTWTSLTYDGNNFIALSGSGGFVAISEDGSTWSTVRRNTALGEHSWYTLIYANNKLIAVSVDGYVSTSTDGSTWAAAVQNTNLGSHQWMSIAYDNNKLVAIATEGYKSIALPTSANYFTDETSWQTAATTYGTCGKFVYAKTNYYCWKPSLETTTQYYTLSTRPQVGDTVYRYRQGNFEAYNTITEVNLPSVIYIDTLRLYRMSDLDTSQRTIRLPKITGIVEGTTDIAALGDLVEAGLPNIVGEVNGTDNEPLTFCDNASGSGALTMSNYQSWGGVDVKTGASYNGIMFNASWSSSLYKDNFNKVQPQTIKILYYIVIANFTKTAIIVNIDNIMTDVNGKADRDLVNISSTGDKYIAHNSSPSNTKYLDYTLGASDATYTMTADGILNLRVIGSNVGNFKMCNISKPTDAYQVGGVVMGNGYYAGWAMPVSKGDIIQINYQLAPAYYGLTLIYATGAESEA